MINYITTSLAALWAKIRSSRAMLDDRHKVPNIMIQEDASYA